MLEHEIEIAYKKLREAVNEAFATVPYPGDNHIVPLVDGSPPYREWANAADQFRGKHWKDILPETLFAQRSSLRLFTPEAFQFYLPAYLLTTTLDSKDAAALSESVFFYLTPPETQGEEMDKFLKYVAPLTIQQRSAINEFIKIYVELETSYEDPKRLRAKQFWAEQING